MKLVIFIFGLLLATLVFLKGSNSQSNDPIESPSDHLSKSLRDTVNSIFSGLHNEKLASLDRTLEVALNSEKYGSETSEGMSESIKWKLFENTFWWVRVAAKTDAKKLQIFFKESGVVVSDSEYAEQTAEQRKPILVKKLKSMKCSSEKERKIVAWLLAMLENEDSK